MTKKSSSNQTQQPDAATDSESHENLPAKRNPFKKSNFNFQYKFTREELEDKSKQLAKSCEERNAFEDQKKSIMSDFKSKIDSKNAEINIISSHINAGTEWVTKTCDVEYDFDNGSKNYFWNGQKVGTEKMTPNDYQIKADLDSKETEEEE